MKKIITAALLALTLAVTGCSTQASVSSQNISKDAEEFKVDRRIVAINLIDGKYLLEVRGKCSIETEIANQRLVVVCKTGANPDTFVKQYVGWTQGAQVSYTIEQLSTSQVDSYRYSIVFRPEQIVPIVIG